MRLAATLICAFALSLPASAVGVDPERKNGVSGDTAGADRLFIGRIYLRGLDTRPVVALATDADGRVVATGDARSVRMRLQQRGRAVEETVLDGTVIPGLIDAHGHLLGLGFALLQADLVGTHDSDEVLARLRSKAADLGPEDWLQGRGWDQNDWPDQAFPTRAVLDRIYPERPVFLERVDGHAAWVNSAALRLAGLTAATPDPQGGRILRDAEGEPTGVLIDNAVELVAAVIPPPTRALKRRAMRLAVVEAARAGLTGVHDAGVSLDDLAILTELADEGQLPIRVYAMADGDRAALARLCRDGVYVHPSGRLQMRAAKFYADGALGSRGAALLAPYADDAGNRGLMIQPAAELAASIRKAADCGVQPAVHAIGDRANRVALDAYASLSPGQREALRPRIEHAQVVALEDIPRFAELGVIASMQPTHATSDMPWAQARIGAERLRGAYAWQRFRAAGAAIALGSDFPVERVDPLLGLYAAVNRQDSVGEPPGGWLPEQKLSLPEALDGFSRGAAYAAGQEAELGTLEVGKRADFTVLSMDPHKVRGRGLLALKVRSTWLDGQRVSGM
ncbi:MAG: amidohydrolase [Lysobacterales bacterium]